MTDPNVPPHSLYKTRKEEQCRWTLIKHFGECWWEMNESKINILLTNNKQQHPKRREQRWLKCRVENAQYCWRWRYAYLNTN